jgi:hypothetical protein
LFYFAEESLEIRFLEEAIAANGMTVRGDFSRPIPITQSAGRNAQKLCGLFNS